MDVVGKRPGQPDGSPRAINFTVAALAEKLIGLYGGQVLGADESPARNLGRADDVGALLYVESPRRVTGMRALQRARNVLNSFAGASTRIIVIGWRFAPNLGQAVESLGAGVCVEVAGAPTEAMSVGPKPLDRSGFSPLPETVVEAVSARRAGRAMEVAVRLGGIRCLSPTTARMQAVGWGSVDHWLVDPDHDGTTFRSGWDSRRLGPGMPREMRVRVMPRRGGPRCVGVQVVDTWGVPLVQTVEVEEG